MASQRLDIDTRCPGYLTDEIALTPHNVDSVYQASMISTLFTKIAEILEGEQWIRGYGNKKE